MRRISVDEVRAACEATGYRLEQRVTLDRNRKCGCPMGIIADAEDANEAAKVLGLDMWYAEGLMAGFDRGYPLLDFRPAYDIGYDDGAAIRLALLPPSPIQP